MGIDNFTKIVKYATESGMVIQREYKYGDFCDFDVVLIDLMSYCYSNLLEIKNVLTINDDDVKLSQKVYEEVATKCFDKISNSLCSMSLFKCKEIFIAYDIKAPITKSQTQYKRRARGVYIDANDRLQFYKAIVSEFVNGVKYHTTGPISVTYPMSFEGYEAGIEYDKGEGEYIGMNYVKHAASSRGYKKFAFLGNDNDILLISSIMNTVIPDIEIYYIPMMRFNMNTMPGRKIIKNPNIVSSFKFMCNTFMVGNDFIPSIYSGTDNQLKKIFSTELPGVHFNRLALNMFERNVVDNKLYQTTFEIVEDFVNVLYDLLTSGSSLSRANKCTDITDNHNLIVFIKRFVWNTFYYSNILYSLPGQGLYEWFSKKIPTHRTIEIDDISFTDNPNDCHNLRFLIEYNYKSGTLRDIIDDTIKSIFHPFDNIILDNSLFLRATARSAGIDFKIRENIHLEPYQIVHFSLDNIPASLYKNFFVHTRSSSFMAGLECWLDEDIDPTSYHTYKSKICILNNTPTRYEIKKDQRIFQYIFKPDGPLVPIDFHIMGMRGPSECLKYETDDRCFSYTYTGQTYTNDTDVNVFYTINTDCFLGDVITENDTCVYVRIVQVGRDTKSSIDNCNFTIYDGIIDADFKCDIKILCKIGPGSSLKTGTKIVYFKMYEYININCSIKTEIRTGGIGSSDFV